ncbi:MAG: hypothetical protein QOI63_1136 [Thermoplasmata archaeon]|nr:hypothetical protein [Thermoplasmata archaeon]
MRAPLLLIPILALLALPAAAAPSPPLALDFAPPAQFSGAAAGEGLQWALLVFRGGDGAFQVDLPGAATAVNHTSLLVDAGADPHRVAPSPALPDRSAPRTDPLHASLAMAGGWASLLVVADRIGLAVEAGAGTLGGSAPGRTPSESLPPIAFPVETVRWGHKMPAAQATLGIVPLGTGVAVRLRVEGLRAVEWHNATVACQSAGPCPDGGGVAGLDEGPSGARTRVERYFYSELTAGGGTLEGHGTAWAVAAGGAAPDVALHGAVRLPLARLRAPCAACPDPAGGTLQATGNVTLSGLAPDGAGRLRANVAGLEAVRVDEQGWQVPPAAAVAAVASLALLAPLLARLAVVLFARTTGGDVLENPRRRALLDRIVAQPGLSFRELQRASRLGIGTAVHHLRVLVRAGHVVAQPYQHTVRYFENHGRYRATWREVAVLADPGLSGLHGWIAAHPRASQREVVQHAHAAWGWRRSATQDRLAALVREHLVEAQPDGRRTLYLARAAPQVPPPA